jgi:hypothetical protein
MTDVIASPAIREMIIKTVRDTTSILMAVIKRTKDNKEWGTK